MPAGDEIGMAEMARWLERIESQLTSLGTTLVVKAVYDVQHQALKDDLDRLRKHLTWLAYTIAGIVISVILTAVLKGLPL